MKSKKIVLQTLRWVAVLPGALAASLAIEVAAGLFYTLFNPTEPLFWVNLIKSCLGSFVFVWVGHWIAPTAKHPIALVLAILMTLVGVTGLWAGVQIGERLLDTVADCVPQMVVPGITYWQLRHALPPLQ